MVEMRVDYGRVQDLTIEDICQMREAVAEEFAKVGKNGRREVSWAEAQDLPLSDLIDLYDLMVRSKA